MSETLYGQAVNTALERGATSEDAHEHGIQVVVDHSEHVAKAIETLRAQHYNGEISAETFLCARMALILSVEA